ncbi:uncharacterized protein LOC101856916 [Aplysia californica]|uniref:Uncharacterized protein LOC101856916 n=1 Tax=Aplysia californica TaxID=6500 RepID=A0ABM1A7L8_APLCA|nr:uncharacterized protein LOC101856916 [Aplysia californica]
MIDLRNPQFVMKTRLAAYGALIFFSFFISIGISQSKSNTGDCILFYDGTKTGQNSNCDFTTAIAIILQLLFLLFRVVTLFLVLHGTVGTDHTLFSDTMEQAYVAIDFIAFVLTFAGASILSPGVGETCENMLTICSPNPNARCPNTHGTPNNAEDTSTTT